MLLLAFVAASAGWRWRRAAYGLAGLGVAVLWALLAQAPCTIRCYQGSDSSYGWLGFFILGYPLWYGFAAWGLAASARGRLADRGAKAGFLVAVAFLVSPFLQGGLLAGRLLNGGPHSVPGIFAPTPVAVGFLVGCAGLIPSALALGRLVGLARRRDSLRNWAGGATFTCMIVFLIGIFVGTAATLQAALLPKTSVSLVTIGIFAMNLAGLISPVLVVSAILRYRLFDFTETEARFVQRLPLVVLLVVTVSTTGFAVGKYSGVDAFTADGAMLAIGLAIGFLFPDHLRDVLAQLGGWVKLALAAIPVGAGVVELVANRTTAIFFVDAGALLAYALAHPALRVGSWLVENTAASAVHEGASETAKIRAVEDLVRDAMERRAWNEETQARYKEIAVDKLGLDQTRFDRIVGDAVQAVTAARKQKPPHVKSEETPGEA